MTSRLFDARAFFSLRDAHHSEIANMASPDWGGSSTDRTLALTLNI